MPGLRSKGPAVLPDTVPKELQPMTRRDAQIAARRAREETEGLPERQHHFKSVEKPEKNKRNIHNILSEINVNTGLSGHRSDPDTISTEMDAVIRQLSADSCAGTSVEGALSSESCDHLHPIYRAVSAERGLSSAEGSRRKKMRSEGGPQGPLQPTPTVAAAEHRACGQVFYTPNSLADDKPPRLGVTNGAPKATPRDEMEKIVDVDSEYQGSDYDTKYSKQLANALLEREELYLQPAGTYSAVQVEVSLDDHAELVDWMAEVVYTQELQIDVLFLAVHIMDCVLKLKPMKRKSFQLLGATCIFLASKVEEVQAIAADTIVRLAGNAFRVDDLVKMEIFITAVLDYMVTIPTRLQFLDRILFAADLSEKEKMFAKYLLELSLHDVTFNRFRFSKVAAAAVNLARQTLRPLSDSASMIWNPVLRHYSHCTDEELVDAVYALHLLHGTSDSCSFFTATVAKYESVEYLSVSRLICPRPYDLRFSSTLACDQRPNRNSGNVVGGGCGGHATR